MYGKLVLQNVKRSIKDYLIYIVTMMICVMLFYAFLSISSIYYKPDIGVEYNVGMLNDGMKLAICGITLLLFFLIKYVNHYMLLHRKKEFAIQAAMGMEQRVISWLFFVETLAMGIVAIVFGIFLGTILSQFISAMLLTSYGQSYRFTWMLFPDTVVLTICFFMLTMLIVGIGNIRAIRRVQIIDMLYADRKNEPAIQKSKYMHVVTFFYCSLLICMTATGLSQVHYYYDARFPLLVRIMYWGNIAAPAISLMAGILFSLLRFGAFLRNHLRRLTDGIDQPHHKSVSFQQYLAAASILSVINTLFAAGFPMLRQMYYLASNDGTLRLYLLYLIFDIIFLICCIIYLASSLLTKWKEKNPAYKYKNTNLFFFGQIISKLSTTSKIMTLICLTLVISCCLFTAMPALAEWAEGYLELRAVYDIQISTGYNGVYEESDLPKDRYELVTEFLTANAIGTVYDRTLDLYLTRHDDFYNRVKLDFPVVAISLSDYNALREMQGYEPITLKENEFTTQWQAIATAEDKTIFLDSHKTISTDAGNYQLAERSCYTDSLGETLYNSYTDVIYVFPDSACKKFLPVMRDRYIITEESISYDSAKALESSFLQKYPVEPDTNTGIQYYFQMRTLQINDTKAGIFIMQTSMTYGAIVLMVTCLTILSLQQLSESSQYTYRFGILHKLGVEQQEREHLALKQLAVWFGLPVTVALLMSAIIISCFFKTITVQITAYIGWHVLLQQVTVMTGILGALLICYFMITYILFKPVIHS